MKRLLLVLSITVFSLLISDWSYKANQNIHKIKDELTSLDREKAKIKDYYNNNLYLYDRPDIVASWFKVTDKYILKIFNEANSLDYDDRQLVFEYPDRTFIKLDRDMHICKDNMPFYKIEFPIGYALKQEDYLEDISTFEFMVKPILINNKIYYFTEMNRIFNQRGGVEYGAFRILKKVETKYVIICRQEDVLPVIKEINGILKQQRHDSQKMAWVPALTFSDYKNEKGYLYFNLGYGFSIPICQACPANGILIRWCFDGKTLKPLNINLMPWDVYDEQGNVHTKDGKEYLLK